MTTTKKKKNLLGSRDGYAGNHFMRIPDDLWDRVERERDNDPYLGRLDGVSVTIVVLAMEALDARKGKRRAG